MPTLTPETIDHFAFFQPLILLAAAVAFVPISNRFGFGAILGYLAAGVFVGPVTRLITETDRIFEVSELGVVLFLFIVGLELRPARLWAMRASIFGLGLAQVLTTGALLTLVFCLAGWRVEPGLIIGFGLAMSSTAYGMQTLAERNDISSPYGEKAIAILLFQDLAIVPLLAAVPLLAPGSGSFASSGVGEAVKVAAALAALLLAGRYLLNPLFRLLALTRSREMMTAAALLAVLGAAALMDFAGMSMAMGAFIAGVMLADSSYRHELEANIEPFRGLLLGLFFMAVGMSINVENILYSWARIALAVPIVMLVKAVVLYAIVRLSGAVHNEAVRVALLLPQAGEFAFVLFASASAVRALWPSETALVAGIVTFTIVLTPVAGLLLPYLLRKEEDEVLEEDFEGAGGSVLLVGFGRFGQIVAQVLLARNVDATIIDANAERIRQAARFGFRIYFGDGTRRDVLRAAGAEKASIICICVDQAAVATRIAEIALAEFGNAKVYVRSWDRAHTIELLGKGVEYELRETYESAVVFGAQTLLGLGIPAAEVDATVTDVRRRDADRLALQVGGDLYAPGPFGPRRDVEPEPLVAPAHRTEARQTELRLAEPPQERPASDKAEV
jgi:CPA2 family monovalent cation:H+ antiporter-2